MNHGSIRAMARDVLSSITDDEFFLSVFFLEFLQTIVTGVTKRYDRRITIRIISDPDPSAPLAYTNGLEIVVNVSNFILVKMDRPHRFRAIIGHVLHECAHILFTDFVQGVQTKKHFKNTGRLIPEPSNTALYQNYIDCMNQIPNEKVLYLPLLNVLDNIMQPVEDGYVDSRILIVIPGYGKDRVFCRDCIYEASKNTHPDAYTENKLEEMLGIIFYLGKYGEDAAPYIRNNDLMTAYSVIKPLVIEATKTYSGEERMRLCNDIFLHIFDMYLKDDINQALNTPPSQENQSGSGDPSDSDGSSDSGSSSSSSSQNSDGNNNQSGTENPSGQENAEQNSEKNSQNGGSGNNNENASNTEQSTNGNSSENTQNNGSETDGSRKEGSENEQGNGEGNQNNAGSENSGSNSNKGPNNGNKAPANGTSGGPKDGNDTQNSSPSNSNLSPSSNSSPRNLTAEELQQLLQQMLNNINSATEGNKDREKEEVPTGNTRPVDAKENSKNQKKQEQDNVPDKENEAGNDSSSEADRNKSPNNDDGTTSDRETAISQLLNKLAEKKAAEKIESEIVKELKHDIDTAEQSADSYYPSSIHRALPGLDDTAVRSAVKPISTRIQKKLQELLKDMQLGSVNRGLYVGKRFDGRQSYRRDGRKMMNRKAPTDDPDIAVALLVDCSGSMSGYRKSEFALRTAYIMYDFCRGMNIPIAVYGHRETRAEVRIDSFAEFDSADDKDRQRLMRLLEVSNCNRDGFAIRFVKKRLADRPEQVKLLMIISDGLPNGDNGYSGYTAAVDVRQAVADAKKAGIEVITAGIGESIPDIEAVYRDPARPNKSAKFLQCDDLEKMPRTFLKIVEKHLDIRN